MTSLNHSIAQVGSSPGFQRRKWRMPRQLHAWIIWMVSVSFVLFQFFLQLSSGEMIANLMQSFSLTAFGGGLLASSYYYVYVLLQAPAGLLVDRFGPRLLMSLGAVAVSVGCYIFAHAHGLFIALLGRLLMGGGAAFAFVGCLNLIRRWFCPKRFGFMTAMAETVGMLGSISGGLLLAKSLQVYDWRQCLGFSAVIGALLAMLLWILVRDRAHGELSDPARPLRDFIPGARALLVKPQTWLNGVYSGLVFAVITVFIALWGIPFLQQAHHLSLFSATAVCDTAFIGVAIGCPLLGYLDTRFSRRYLMMFLGPLMAAIILLILIFWVSLPIVMCYGLMLLLGIAVSTYMLTFIIANEISTLQTQATSIGFVNALSVGTAPLLQPFIGRLLDSSCHHAVKTGCRVGAYQHVLWVMPLLMVVAALVALLMRRLSAR